MRIRNRFGNYPLTKGSGIIRYSTLYTETCKLSTLAKNTERITSTMYSIDNSVPVPDRTCLIAEDKRKDKRKGSEAKPAVWLLTLHPLPYRVPLRARA